MKATGTDMTESHQNSTSTPDDSRSLAMLAIAVALLLLATAAASAGSIQLSDEAASTGPDILLRDVATLEGDDAQALGEAVVGSFIEGDAQTILTRDAIKEALKDGHKVNWARLNFGGFAKCTVHRQGGTIDAGANESIDINEIEESDSATVIVANPEQPVSIELPLTIRDRVDRYLAQYTGMSADELVAEFPDRELDALAQSAVQGRWEVAPVPGVTGKLGRIPLTVRQYAHTGELLDSMRFTANVARRTQVVIIKTTVERGRMFTRDMLETREELVSDDRVSYPATAEAIIGMTASQKIRANSVINSNDIQKPVLVERGSMIHVYAIAGSLVVRDTARANEDGTNGQIIEVRNERSRDTYYVRVTGSNEGRIIDDLKQVQKERGEES